VEIVMKDIIYLIIKREWNVLNVKIIAWSVLD
jgi:hypothetical protein